MKKRDENIEVTASDIRFHKFKLNLNLVLELIFAGASMYLGYSILFGIFISVSIVYLLLIIRFYMLERHAYKMGMTTSEFITEMRKNDKV
jgi:hypothetical protein